LAVEVVIGILEEVASTVVGGGVVTIGTTVVDLVMSGVQAVVVEDQVLAVEVEIGAMTILMAATSRITVEGLSVVALVVVEEDLARIQVAAVDMAQVAEWEVMAEVGVGTEPA
jgi:hypothetical protein